MRSVHLQLTTASEGARTYHFAAHNEDGSRTIGWALATVNDRTGELAICSDWGNFSHRWSPDPKHLGAHDLTHFIAQCNDPPYLTNKLVPGDGLQFSSAKTTESLVERLIEIRREHIERWGRKPDLDAEGMVRFSYPKRRYLTHELLYELREQLGDLEHEVGGHGESACAVYFERLPHDIHQFIDTTYEYSASEETWDAKHLRTILTPAVIAACKIEVERRFRELGDVAQIVWAMYEGARSKDYRYSLPVCACGPVKSNLDCRGASTGAIGTRCSYWGSLCGSKPEASRRHDGHGSQTDENQRDYRATLPACDNYAPAGFSGHWRDWHRGHGCRLDPGAKAPVKGATT